MDRLRRWVRTVFGDLHWSPPPWVRAAVRPLVTANAVRHRAPRRFWSSVAGIAAVVSAGVGLNHWIASWPEPEYLAVSVHHPQPTRLEPNAKPFPVRIRFSGAAAPLERVGKEVVTDFRVTPVVAGRWRWIDDQELVFEPDADWPIGQRYELLVERGFLAPQALLEKSVIEFRAPPLTARLASNEFYEDPTDAKNKRAVFAIEFSHPVDKASLEKRLTLRSHARTEPGFDAAKARPLGFSLSFDDSGAKAFVRSEPIAIPDEPGTVQLQLERGVRATREGEPSADALSGELSIPGVDTYFRVARVAGSVVTNAAHRMERIVSLEFTAPVRAADLRMRVAVFELPAGRPAIGDRPEEPAHVWRDVDEVVPEVLANARRLDVDWLASEPEFSKLQSFRFHATPKRSLLVRIEKGTPSFGGYELAKPSATLLTVDPLPRTVEILHEGSLLALSGGRRLSVLTRNVGSVEIELARLLPDSVAHLASQTRGRFQEPDFRGDAFGIDDLSEVFREVQPLSPGEPGEPQYFAVDFGRFVSQGATPRGLFDLRVSGWDAEKKKRYANASDRRLVLVTDLGFLVKDAADGSHEVYVMSIATGRPVADAEVRLLGKNGLPVLVRTTDADGHAQLPSVEGLEREKAPTVYVIQKGGDLAFLPYDRNDRRVDLSRSDVGGLYDEKELESLQAFLFSDRGVYRPGEEVTLGVIVKPLDWKPLPDGLPLEIAVIDPRGLEVRSEPIRVPHDGFLDWHFATLEGSATGTYQIQIHIVRDGERKGVLGQASVRVEEFLPDRMTIDVRLSAGPAEGWIAPAALSARVSLRNLFGSPAVGNRVRGTLRLSPSLPPLARWSGWTFVDPLGAKQSYDETLAEVQTNDAGEVEFPLGLERFDRATYRLRFVAEGFEAESGRRVSIDTSAIVSPLPYLVAWKADGDLSYVKRDSERAVEIVAVGPTLDPVTADDVHAELIEITHVRVLARQPSGLLAYQSVKKETSRGTQAIPLRAATTRLPLPTANPGHFVYVLRDAAGTELNRVSFEVVGEGNVAGRVERNAELRVQLEKSDYAPGEEIELSVQAPYAGAGLITIERDRVYAAKWFQASGNATVQRIRVPESLEGNGYVVVSFVRDLGSSEIYLSPLSSGAAPFSVSRARRTQALTIRVPERVAPGEKMHIQWTAREPTKIAVFAVDEGVLQVARWTKPDPLSRFFRKRALTVTTTQILDLLLPEYDIVRSLAAPGGDEDRLLAGNLNPFKRKGQKPVAFWSGVRDVPAGAGSVDFEIPDHFHGTVRAVAVAVNDVSVGVAEAKAIVRGPFVLQPTAPYFAAPGDEFEVTLLVANTLDGSGTAVPVHVALETSPELEVLAQSEQSVAIDEGRDANVRWRLRVKDAPGSARLTFRASSDTHATATTLEMSVRPAAPRQTTLVTRVATHGGSVEIPVDRVLFPHLREATAGMATSPLGLVPGLAHYLDTFPHGCSEQVVSAALPGIVLASQPDLALDPERARVQFERAIAVLQARQNASGGFGIWDAETVSSPWIDAYATHFLLEARGRGQAVPPSLLRRALERMEAMVDESRGDAPGLRARSYALYLLGRDGRVKTKEARALKDALLADGLKRWQGDIAALFLASVFQQLRLEDEALKLLVGASVTVKPEPDHAQHYDASIARALSLYLLAKHFPERVRDLAPDDLLALSESVTGGQFNTLSSALLILALDAWGNVVPPLDLARAGIEEVSAAGVPRAIAPVGRIVLRAPVSADAARVRFTGPDSEPFFFQLLQSGFDRELPHERAAHGLEVEREIRGPDGAPAAQVGITSKLDVSVLVRSVDGVSREVAVVDLLPGGFEVDLSSDALAERRSLVAGDDVWRPTYVDVREDRVVFYGWVSDRAERFVYRIKPTNQGSYGVPPALIEGLYDRAAWGRGLGGEIRVGD